jgi:predicted  nucleic acid-binding Zn-ribbon protein
MTDTLAAELAMWDARCNDLQNSLDRVREERDDLKTEARILEAALTESQRQLAIYMQMVERMRVAMAQGIEL